MPELLDLVPKEVVTSQQPRGLSPGQVAQPYEELGRSLQTLSTGLSDVAVPLAEKQAAADLNQQKVTRGPDGSIQVANPANAVIFGEAGKAYERAVVSGTVAQAGNLAAQDMTQLHRQFPLDPQGFSTSAQAHLDKIASGQGDSIAGQEILREGRSLYTQHLDAITNAAAMNDVDNSKKSILATIDDQKNTAIALARQPGGTDAPEFKQSVAKLNAAYDALGTNPLFKTPQDQIDLEKKNTVALLQSEGVVAHIDDTFNKKSKAEAQKELTDSVLNNPNLREVDRDRLYRFGMAHLEFLTGDQQASIQASRQTTTDIEKLVSTGKLRPDDPAIGSAITQAKAIGDDSSVLRLQAAIKVAPALNASAALPSAQRPAAMGVGDDYFSITRRLESSGNDNAVSHNPKTGAPIAYGRYQFTAPTWDQVGKDHPELGLTPLNIFNPDKQEQAMRAFTADNAAVLQHEGLATTAPNLRMSAFLGRTGGPSFLRAMQFSPDGNAAAMFPKEAQANPSIFYGPGGQARTFAQVFAVSTKAMGGAQVNMTGGAPSANGGMPFSQADVARNPYLLSAYFRTLAADPEDRGETVKATAEAAFKAIDAGIKPSDDAIALVYQAADRDKAKFGFLGSELTGKLAALGAAGMSGPDRAAFADQARAAAVAAPDIYHQAIATAAMTQAKQQERLQAEQPYTAAANRFGTPTPAAIDPAHPELAGQALAQRGVLSQHIGALDGTPPPPLLEKGDEPALRALLQGPQAAQVLPQIAANMRPDDLDRLAREPAFKESVVGMSRSGDPAKMNSAYSLMDTLARRNPLSFDAEYKEGVKDLSVWQSLLSQYPPAEAAKRMMRANDPAQAGAIEDAKKVADEALKALTPAAVVSKFSTGWGPFGTTAQAPVNPDGAANASMALRREYGTAYREAFASSGDVHAADVAATNAIKIKFATSPTNGNRVMAYAPEGYYPPVDGSRDWMAKQLDDDVAKLIKTQYNSSLDVQAFDRPGALPQYGGSEQDAAAMAAYRAPRALVPDQTTQADIAAHKPPSYTVVVQQPDGRFSALAQPDGTPLRYRFDPSQFQADLAARKEQERNTPAPDIEVRSMR